MKKKQFGISPSLSRGMTETINAVKNNAGALRFEVVPLSRIQIDVSNPRELAITPRDIAEGLKDSDPLFSRKTDELERLQRLGDTIKRKGLINPIVLYKKGDKYPLVTGERRFLSCLLIGKEDIQARIFDQEPSDEDVKIIQWIENNEREDLSLKDRLGNIRSILSAMKLKQPDLEVTVTFLKEILTLSKAQASQYLTLLNAPGDVQKEIVTGKINSMEKAALIAKVTDSEIRATLIKSCEEGATVKQMELILDGARDLKAERLAGAGYRKRGVPGRVINLGRTENLVIIKRLVTCVVDHPRFSKYAPFFSEINWEHRGQVTQGFRKLLEFLEAEND
ncbi:MAG: ParB/RepB/Spo0J family partition protein [Candidatus Manganitrophaceae bacterium]